MARGGEGAPRSQDALAGVCRRRGERGAAKARRGHCGIVLPQRMEAPARPRKRNGISSKEWNGFRKSRYSSLWAKKILCVLLVSSAHHASNFSPLSPNASRSRSWSKLVPSPAGTQHPERLQDTSSPTGTWQRIRQGTPAQVGSSRADGETGR